MQSIRDRMGFGKKVYCNCSCLEAEGRSRWPDVSFSESRRNLDGTSSVLEQVVWLIPPGLEWTFGIPDVTKLALMPLLVSVRFECTYR